MGISIPFLSKLFGDTTDIVKEAVTDKDAQNRILGSLEELGQNVEREIYLAELKTKTVPWVDAVHKLGRQLLNFFSIAATALLIAFNYDINQYEALLLGGGNVAYQLIKGRGN